MRSIVMTGGTSGIGLETARLLLAEPGTTLILGVRGMHRAAEAQSILSPSGAGSRLVLFPLDLCSLLSVRTFADRILNCDAIDKIDALMLNAGAQFLNVDGRTAEGYEVAFGGNHLAHHLLTRLLLDRMDPVGTIVFTASGTHDPARKTGMPAPRHALASLLADPSKDPQLDADPAKAGRRAYAASKLCNVMTVRELAARLTADRANLNCIAFDPGLMPGTGLVRQYSPVFRNFIWPFVLPLLRVFVPFMNKPEVSARRLFELAIGRERSPENGGYAEVIRGRLVWAPPSTLAQSKDDAVALWQDSVAMADLPDVRQQKVNPAASNSKTDI